ncbi:HEPN domain-containing protein [uncultured Cardiobacterium sp.]|uniref:HEPN domain-containing protein n=1 Tax=uncultured Cardiobacterium sp. TaxID=417619 RepID=UPI002604C768|nr:HEPN domain-containing protein [uncultured Cardiobacterium sp.]
MNSQELQQTFIKNKEQYSEALRLRIYRSISWLKKAEASEADDDIRFITLWIAFNAAYAKEMEAGMQLSDRTAFRQFLHTVCRLDKEQRIYRLVWETFSGSIRLLLENRYVFQPFWNFHNGKISESVWEEDFARAKQKAKTALANKDTNGVLLIVFDRLYTLRNQILHGGATYNSSANRKQLRDGCAILQQCVPLILAVMLDNPDEDWGKPFYPYVKEE